jgi:type IV secretory pathway ATPase VirB11/archaellum biosynthesis ATPase
MVEPWIDGLLRRAAGLAEVSDVVLEPLDDGALAVRVRIAWVVQVEMRPHLQFGFPEALRAALRRDPDLLVIPEVRDPITAQSAVRAVLSGHLVITTQRSWTGSPLN